MIKTYVVDTNVLIQAPYALHCFEDNRVVLPVAVLEELDHLKKADGETGANARKAIRLLEELRHQGDLLTGVKLYHGGSIRIEKNFVDVLLPADLPDDKMDNRILKVCKGLKGEVILVTKDILLRIKAQIIGIKAEDFTTEQVSGREEQYQGRIEAYAPEESFKEFKKKGILVEQIYVTDESGKKNSIRLWENQFVILKADQSTKKTVLGRVCKGRVVPLEY